jgi:DNA polymerase III psi subunit
MINSDIKDVASLFDEFYFIDDDNIIGTKENEKKHKILVFEPKVKPKIVFIYPNIADLTSTDKIMIDKLVQAGLKYTSDEVLEIDLYQNRDFTLDEILNEIEVNSIVYWGGYKGTTHHLSEKNNKKVLHAKALKDYHNNKDFKIELWQLIQKII